MSIPVLIVDDSPLARKMLRKSLPSTWDISITEAGNGKEALAAYRSGKAHVMFLDLTMPEMDGFELLDALRSEDLNCLVIVVSADVQPQARERALKLGAVAFIEKPIDVDKVDAVLKRFGISLGV
jgi:two-component system chemotaxis response regulator CheY